MSVSSVLVTFQPPQDYVLLELHPGDEYTHQYQIDKELSAGSYWYHPHVHGSVHFQVNVSAVFLAHLKYNYEQINLRAAPVTTELSCVAVCSWIAPITFRGYLVAA